MTLNLDKLLTQEQKTDVLTARLKALDVDVEGLTLRYDQKYSWDFSVSRGSPIRVVASVSVGSRRWMAVTEELARAIKDVRGGLRVHVQRGLGPFAERNLV